MKKKIYEKIIQKELEKIKFDKLEYRDNNTGLVDSTSGTIKLFIPRPKTINTLATGLHEIGHIVLKNEGKGKKIHYREYLAEMFCNKKLKENNIPLTKQVKENQRKNVDRWVKFELDHGRINKSDVEIEVLNFLG